MHSKTYAALGAPFAAVAAMPVKRDIETNTVTEIDFVTEFVTEVVWVDATGGPVHVGSPQTSPQYTWATTTTSSSSVYVVPTTSSTSQPILATSSSTTQPVPTTSTQLAPTTSTTQAVAPAQTQPAQPAEPTPTTTSTYVPPAPATTSTSQYVAPTTTWSPTTTSAAAAASTGSSSSSKYTGDLTYYDVGLGSCGNTNTDSEMVLAMAVGIMDKATMCGKTITISYNGATTQGTIVDTCMGCADGAIDASPALFKAVAPSGDGRVHGVEWWFD